MGEVGHIHSYKVIRKQKQQMNPISITRSDYK